MKKFTFLAVFILSAVSAFTQQNWEEKNTFSDIAVGWYSSPTFTDLDNDGLLDLIIGEQDGKLRHYEQNSENSTEFSLVTDTFNKINSENNSYLAPAFTDLDNDGMLDLIIGNNNGTLFHYEQNDLNSTEFTLVTDTFNNINLGENIYPVPDFTDLDNDGLLDLIIGKETGNLNHYEQNDLNSTEFSLVTDTFNEIAVGEAAVPAFTDLDKDGLLDLLVGNNEGTLHHYEQKAVNSTEFRFVTDNFNDIDVGKYSVPDFTDLDNDGLLDLVIGNQEETMKHYEQMSENLPVQFSSFTAMQTSGNSVEIEWVTQTENDMRGFYVLKSETEDLASASRFSDLIPASNTVSAHEYVCEDNEVEPNKRYWYWIEALSMSDNSTVTASQSVMLGEFEDPEEEVPEFALETGLAHIYPNPFNPPVNISFFMDEESVEQNERAEIMIYNVKGQEVHRRDLGIKSASGMYTISWNGNDEDGKECGSGIYFVKFTAGSHRSFKKSIKLK